MEKQEISTVQERLSGKIKSLTMALTKSNERVKELETERKDLKKELTQARDEVQRMENEYTRHQEMWREAQELLELSLQDTDSVAYQISELKNQKLELEQQLKQQRALIADYRKKADDARTHAENVVSKYKEREEKLNSDKNAMAKKNERYTCL